MELNKYLITLLVVLFTASCAGESQSDAYGQFEANEVVVSAEVSGRVLELNISEGETAEAGLTTVQIDTATLHLQRVEMRAALKASESRLNQIESEKRVLLSQLDTAEKELARFRALHQEEAATQSQLDRAEGEVNTLNRRIEAIDVQRQSILAEISRSEAKIDQIADQIERATVKNPVRGTVLNIYKDVGELAMPGTPLYQIADLSIMTLRIYISGAQLPDVVLGEDVTVLIDENEDQYEELRGTISWISPEAEFTPQMIQTKEERVTQVYAIKVRVDNPQGRLKIGMPGEIRFHNQSSD